MFHLPENLSLAESRLSYLSSNDTCFSKDLDDARVPCMKITGISPDNKDDDIY